MKFSFRPLLPQLIVNSELMSENDPSSSRPLTIDGLLPCRLDAVPMDLCASPSLTFETILVLLDTIHAETL